MKFTIKEGCNWPWGQREPGESMQQTISPAPGEFRVRPKKTQDPDQHSRLPPPLPPIQWRRRRALLDHQQKTCDHHRHRHHKMKIMRVGINKSIRFNFLLRKRLLSKQSFLAQNTERETQNGGRKQDKKMAIDRTMEGDSQECLDK